MRISGSLGDLESLFRIQRWFQVILQSKVALNSVRIIVHDLQNSVEVVLNSWLLIYEGWNFNSGNYLFTTDTKSIHVSKFYCPSM